MEIIINQNKKDWVSALEKALIDFSMHKTPIDSTPSAADLKATDLEVLSIYGGCYAGFGMYRAQDGDGEPKITSEEQIKITAEDNDRHGAL